MGKKMYRNIGGKRIHVNQLAAQSRQFTVSNNTIPKTDLNQKNYMFSWSKLHLSRFDVDTFGKLFTFDVNKKGEKENFNLIEVDHSWKHERYKQPKRLIKCKKRKYSNAKSYAPTLDGMKEIKREKRNDFKAFKNYPYNLPKMNQTEYMEKLVEHKLTKWERKNPKPMDMFVEDVEKWKQLRENMKMHFRDVVVSIYDKLPLIGRFKIGKTNATYIEKKIADIKDINGEGHNINNLSKSSKLLKVAQKKTNQVHAKCADLVSTNLIDHKRTKGRILLPENLMMMRKAA